MTFCAVLMIDGNILFYILLLSNSLNIIDCNNRNNEHNPKKLKDMKVVTQFYLTFKNNKNWIDYTSHDFIDRDTE